VRWANDECSEEEIVYVMMASLIVIGDKLEK